MLMNMEVEVPGWKRDKFKLFPFLAKDPSRALEGLVAVFLMKVPLPAGNMDPISIKA